MCNIPYSEKQGFVQVLKTGEFVKWLKKQPPKTKAIITSRLDMLAIGHFGDCKRFEGLIEFRWKNGMRMYAFAFDKKIIVMLFGGNKNGQDYDIKKAKKIREKIKEDGISDS